MTKFSMWGCATSTTFSCKTSMREGDAAISIKYLPSTSGATVQSKKLNLIQFLLLYPLGIIDFSKREYSICEHRTGSPLKGNLYDNIRTVASTPMKKKAESSMERDPHINPSSQSWCRSAGTTCGKGRGVDRPNKVSATKLMERFGRPGTNGTTMHYGKAYLVRGWGVHNLSLRDYLMKTQILT